MKHERAFNTRGQPDVFDLHLRTTSTVNARATSSSTGSTFFGGASGSVSEASEEAHATGRGAAPHLRVVVTSCCCWENSSRVTPRRVLHPICC